MPVADGFRHVESGGHLGDFAANLFPLRSGLGIQPQAVDQIIDLLRGGDHIPHIAFPFFGLAEGVPHGFSLFLETGY